MCAPCTLHPSWLLATQVREYSKAEEAEQAEGSAGAQGLREEANAKRRQLEQWSASAYGEVAPPPLLMRVRCTSLLNEQAWRRCSHGSGSLAHSTAWSASFPRT